MHTGAFLLPQVQFIEDGDRSESGLDGRVDTGLEVDDIIILAGQSEVVEEGCLDFDGQAL